MNPFKFGFNGTTDTHTAIPTTREDNYFGKYQHTEPSPNRQNVDVIPADDPALRIVTAQEGAARLTAVWAREKHPQGSVWRDYPQGSLRHHRKSHSCSNLRRLGLHRC